MESFWPMIRPSDLTFIFHGDITVRFQRPREREKCISGMKGARGRRDG